MMYVANPIYDVVFKFMMEDEKVAKILLGALLQKEILQVTMCKHELTNLQSTKIQLYRIDFSAKVREDDGTERMILIELQKTWLATETLRFRRYLGKQYQDSSNIPSKNNPYGFATPMVTIYLLGHLLGNLEEPIVYVRRHYYDYDSNLLNCEPDPFIESLTHDSIIVQIPYLQQKVRNKLESLLRIFDQSLVTDNKHLISVTDDMIGNDPDMDLVVRRLLMASSEPQVREDMDAEDEMLSEIEARDTTIMLKDKIIAEKDNAIADMDNQLAEKDNAIAEKDNAIADRDNQLAEKDNAIAEKDNAIAEKDNAIAEKDNAIADRDNQLAEKGKALLSSAKALKAAGISVNDISAMTTLSVEEIERL